MGGINGSGKSVLINHIATGYSCQVLLYDTKDEFTVPGIEPVHHPEQLDWNQRVLHLVDDAGDLGETNRLFKTAWQRKAGRSGLPYGLVIVVHELGDLCADTPGATPQWVSVLARKGRAHGIGMLCGGQRPRNIPRVTRSESSQVISMASGFDPEDVPVMAAMHRLTVPEFETALAKAATLGEHAYLWYDKRARSNVIRPPLPPERLRRTIAHGIDPSAHRTPENSGESSGADELRSSGTRSGDPNSPESAPENSGTLGSPSTRQ